MTLQTTDVTGLVTMTVADDGTFTLGTSRLVVDTPGKVVIGTATAADQLGITGDGIHVAGQQIVNSSGQVLYS